MKTLKSLLVALAVSGVVGVIGVVGALPASATSVGLVDVQTPCGVVRISDSSGPNRLVQWRTTNPATWGRYFNLNGLGWNPSSALLISSNGRNFRLQTLCYDNRTGRAYSNSYAVH